MHCAPLNKLPSVPKHYLEILYTITFCLRVSRSSERLLDERGLSLLNLEYSPLDCVCNLSIISSFAHAHASRKQRTMKCVTCTGFSCPMRCTRSMAVILSVSLSSTSCPTYPDSRWLHSTSNPSMVTVSDCLLQALETYHENVICTREL